MKIKNLDNLINKLDELSEIIKLHIELDFYIIEVFSDKSYQIKIRLFNDDIFYISPQADLDPHEWIIREFILDKDLNIKIVNWLIENREIF